MSEMKRDYAPGDHVITLYSTHCPKCNVLKEKLENAGVMFTEINDIQVMADKGFMSAPMLVVGGQTMNFKAAVQWLNDLED